MDGANPAGALMKDDGLSGVMIAGIVLFAAIGVAIPMFFLYRRHKRVKWDKAVEAVLVRDLELGPKVSNEGMEQNHFPHANGLVLCQTAYGPVRGIRHNNPITERVARLAVVLFVSSNMKI